MQSLSSSFSLLFWTSKQVDSSMLPYCSSSTRCSTWISILQHPSLLRLLYYYCHYKSAVWGNNQVAGESQIQCNSWFLVLVMYSFCSTSTEKGSTFAVGDWTICFLNQLLWRVSISASMSDTPAFLSSRSITFSLEFLMPNVTDILLHHIGFSVSPPFLYVFCKLPKGCVHGLFHSWFLLLEDIGLCSLVSSQNLNWISLHSSFVGTIKLL